jgi:3-dehydrosphinganine reductase
MAYSTAAIAIAVILFGALTYTVFKMLGFGSNEFPVDGKVWPQGARKEIQLD